MSKGKILVISRTPWSEAPRLRHQISRLIRDIGYEVFYVEVLFKKIKPSTVSEEGINLFRIYEKIHHQLKPFKFLHDLNSYWIRQDLIKVLGEKDFKVIFNFNYDNDFTFSLFHGVSTITVINDDFYTMAKPWMKKQVLASLAFTLRSSTFCLSVSYFLDRQIKKLNPHSELFLPWAESQYTPPTNGNKRDVVLYYGFISRLDLKIIDELVSKGVRMRFIGPIEGNGKLFKEKYMSHPNVEIFDSIPLQELHLDDVCCSLAIYDSKLKVMKALTASNRFFQLLSLGIPLVYPDLPNLIKAPDTVLKRCSSIEQYLEAINFFRFNFDSVQSTIDGFLSEHTKYKRREFLEDLIEKVAL